MLLLQGNELWRKLREDMMLVGTEVSLSFPPFAHEDTTQALCDVYQVIFSLYVRTT